MKMKEIWNETLESETTETTSAHVNHWNGNSFPPELVQSPSNLHKTLLRWSTKLRWHLVECLLVDRYSSYADNGDVLRQQRQNVMCSCVEILMRCAAAAASEFWRTLQQKQRHGCDALRSSSSVRVWRAAQQQLRQSSWRAAQPQLRQSCDALRSNSCVRALTRCAATAASELCCVAL